MKRTFIFLLVVVMVSIGVTSISYANQAYGDGTYLVGGDVAPGLYKVILKDVIMKMGYIERLKGLSKEFDDIIANIVLSGDGYVEILSTDKAVKLQGVEIHKIELSNYRPEIQTEVGDGIYLVGYDIKPGTYKVTLTDSLMNMGYLERISAVSFLFDDIIANEIITGNSYIDIQRSDFAIRVQGVKLTFIE